MTTPAPFSSPLVPPPLDHGVIGNGRVLALVSPTSAIEVAVSATLRLSLGLRANPRREEGRHLPDPLARPSEIRGALRYLPNTNVLSTRFDDGDCAWEVIDFAPRIPEGLTVRVPIEIIRIVRPIRGEPLIRADFDPRPDYGRATPELRPTTGGIEVVGGSVPMHLTTTIPVPYVLAKREIALTDTAVFIVSYGNGRQGEAVVAHALHELDLTAAGWRAWAKTCALPNFGASAVLRSALSASSLHAYHDTGAIIAATTTSVPEAMGTPRTWDYRYCWLRDAAFTVEALRRLGHLSEGEQSLRFLRDVAESGPLQPLYAIDGERALTEEVLPHLAGFGGSGPVRVGNAASNQRQNDLMGELVLCLETLLSDPRIVDEEGGRFAAMLERLVEEAIVAAPTRGPHGDLGVQDEPEALHLLPRDVRRRDPARRHAGAAHRAHRPGRSLGAHRRARARRGAASGIQRRARLLHANPRRAGRRRVAAAPADPRAHRRERPRFLLDGRRL